MKLTPLDVRKQDFKKVLRGFDPEEVEAFLSMVADELESLIHERNRVDEELIKLRTQLRDYQEVKQTLHNTLAKATDTVEETRMNSLREATLRISEAELQAEKITESARSELQELRHEISLLKTQKESFTRRLRHLLESQIELIDVLGMDDIGLSEAEEEASARFIPRGRLPRPVIAEPPLAEKPATTAAVSEPRIIRGDKKFEEPFLLKRSGDNPSASDEPRNEENRLPSNDRLSDQLII
ncbi:DivIVA domain-containing protein [bacterium]|nr:DivIVA domain-containing protein [bacterium]